MAKAKKRTLEAEGQLSLFTDLLLSTDAEEIGTDGSKAMQPKGLGVSSEQDSSTKAAAAMDRDEADNGTRSAQEPVQGTRGNEVPVHAGQHARGSEEDRSGGAGQHAAVSDGLQAQVQHPLQRDRDALAAEAQDQGASAAGRADMAAGIRVDEDLRSRDSEERSDRGPVEITAVTADPGTALARAQANIIALKALAAAEEHGTATEEERRAIAAYAGWGGAADAFREGGVSRDWQQVHDELRSLLSEEEYASARSSVLTAFYTPRRIVGAIYEALESVGLGHAAEADQILEPGCGTGNFMRTVPPSMNLSFTGIEADSLSARIATILLPEQSIVASPMEDCYITDGSFDAAVGNVPYSDAIRIRDNATGRDIPIHDWFIQRSLEAVRPGGLVCVLTSRYSMDKRNSTSRIAMAQQAELAGVVRLPEELFKRTAGTEVISDILLFRKRDRAISQEEAARESWIQTEALDGNPDARVNSYLAAHPECVMGRGLEVESGPYGPTVGVHVDAEHDPRPSILAAHVKRSLADQASASIGHDYHLDLAARKEAPAAAARPQKSASEELYVDEQGNVWYGSQETVEPVEAAGTGDGRLAALVALRDQTRQLLEMERSSSAGDAEVQQAIEALSASYDSFAGRYGRLASKENEKAWTKKGQADASFSVLAGLLEKTDSRGQYLGKTDFLKKRTILPAPPLPDHVDDPHEAIALSMDRRGYLDEEFIGNLLDKHGDELLEALGDAIVLNPDTDALMPAEEYLSGSLGEKLDHVRALISDIETDRTGQASTDWNEAQFGASDPARPEKSAFGDAVKRELVDRGIWATEITPLTGNVAVDSEIQLERMDSYGDKSTASSAGYLLARALDELETTRPLGTRRSNGRPATGNLLIDRLVDEALGRRDTWSHHYQYSGEYYALYLISRHLDKLGTLALQSIFADSDIMDPDGQPKGALASLAAAMGTSLEQANQDANWEQYKAVRRTNIERLAEAFRKEPDAAEYLFKLSLEKEDSEDSRRYRYTENRVEATHEGFLSYKEEKRSFMAEHAKTVDEDRLGRLKELEHRLEGAMPTPLAPGDIAANMGAPWIPARIYAQFARETFGGDGGYDWIHHEASFNVVYDDTNGRWAVNGASAGIEDVAKAKYGTARVAPLKIMQAIMNNSNMVVRTKVAGKTVADTKETLLAWEKRHEVEKAFSEWIWNDPDRAEELSTIYNDRFNRIVPRTYDGSYLSLPGKNASITLRKHQADAVARILQSEEGSLIAHVVGAGKTYACIAAVHEAKRIGKCTKPVIVVPNHITQQWASDFQNMYPGSHVLAFDSNDKAERFWAKAAAGDWDAIIVGDTRFTALGMSGDRKKEHLQQRVEELEGSIREASSSGDKWTVKKCERVKSRVEGQLKKMMSNIKEDDGLTFEQLGCDMLVVDEAHYYKNLAVAGSEVPGMSISPSAKCEDLLAKCNYLREKGFGRNIVFATGTPVSNSMAELYNMQRYLAPKQLRAQGTEMFSSWASTFGELSAAYEMKPEGSGFQMKQRFAKFHNLPELMKSFHCYASLVTKDMVHLDVPECTEHVMAIEAGPSQKEGIRWLAERAEVVRGGCDPRKDNMLKITSDGRKIALDPKLLDPEDASMLPLSDGKIAACAKTVKEIYDRTAAQKGTQLIFCDSSTDAGKGWNAYKGMRDELIKNGIPPEQIAFVSSAGDDPEKRDALFEKVSNGEIRVLLGSTMKLGTGTNVQERLAAIHDLDCPWRPADLEQRLGRIVRQGNTFDKVEDYRYVTTGTFDAYMYQTVERKQRFISQIFTSKTPSRTMEDLDETVLDYAEIKALAAGDPNVAKRMTIQNEIGQLKLLKQGYDRERSSLQSKIQNQLEPSCRALEAAQKDLATAEVPFKKAAAAAEADTKLPSERREAICKDLYGKAASLQYGFDSRIGSYHGLEVWGRCRIGESGEPVTYMGLKTAGIEPIWCKRQAYTSTSGPYTVLRQLKELAADCSKGPQSLQPKVDEARRRLEDAKTAASQPWEKADRLVALEQELKELDIKTGLIDQGGQEDLEEQISMEDSVREWYMSAYPDDPIGPFIEDISFGEAEDGFAEGVNMLGIAGNESEKRVMERLKDKLADIHEASNDAMLAAQEEEAETEDIEER